MKTWHFDIKLGNGQVASIDAYTFEQAFALLKMDKRYVEGNWTLVGVEDKIPEPDPTAEEIKKQSDDLWAKVEKTLEAGCEAFKNAMAFDEKHQDVIYTGPAHTEGKCQLKQLRSALSMLTAG